MSVDTTAPTRTNLLARKAQIKLATEGASLLEGKREVLLKELIARARELRSLRNELHQRGRMAVAALAIARAVRGTPEVRSASVAGRRELEVKVLREKVWGLELSDVAHADLVRTPRPRAMGQFDCSAHILEASEAAEKMLERLIECAPKESNLQILGEEVRKVSRRINALNESLLPRLRADVRRITRVLDEREREDTFRLKRIKRKKSTN